MNTVSVIRVYYYYYCYDAITNYGMGMGGLKSEGRKPLQCRALKVDSHTFSHTLPNKAAELTTSSSLRVFVTIRLLNQNFPKKTPVDH